MMLDFDSAVEAAAPTRPAQLVERVTVTTRPSEIEQAYRAREDEQWSWSDLRDYVVTQIEAVHGPQPRDHYKEMGIFKAFASRWQEAAPAIARHAFEVERGMWRSAPISVSRFAKGSDPYFAVPIAERLAQ
jgi:hypothetical protein